MIAAGSCADAQLRAADCSHRRLVRRLCASVLTADGQGSRSEQDCDGARLRALEDTAHAVLLGFEGDVPYVSPDERAAQAAGGLAEAAQQLRAEGYPGLAAELEVGAERLKRAPAFPLLGSLTEAETGAPLVLPLTEQPALLAFLLALKGSRPSLRQRLFTFQSHGTPAPSPLDASAAARASGAAGPAAGVAAPEQQQEARVPLATSVFEEAPNPQLLSDGSATVAVLLPRELGLPTDAFAGLEVLQDLGAGMASRPVWAPIAAGTSGLPAPREPSWLPLPAALRELRGDVRQGAAPAPLGLPLSLLSMDDEPGSSTVFSAGTAAWDGASDGDAASADSVQPQGSPGRGATAPAVAAPTERQLGGPCQLWSLAEAELARHALLALQGVAASLLRLQALLAAPGALPRRSIAGLLRKLAEAAELRLRLQRFVAALSEGGAAAGAARPGSSGGCSCVDSKGGSCGQDPVQQAFAAAVADVLQRQSAALQQLEQQEGSPWVQAVEVAGSRGRRLFGRGPSLLQVSLHTGRLQGQLRSLADLCWCGFSPGTEYSPMEGGKEEGGTAEEAQQAQQHGQQQPLGGGGSCLWEEGSFPAGVQLLNYLFERANEADDADAPMLRFLFVQAMQPYLRHMHVWAFTTHAVSPEFGTAGDKELLTLDFLPPPPAEEAPGREPPVALVPVDPPAFLQPLHAAFMRAGSQLRLLHSLEQQGRRLAQQLSDIAELEVRQRQAAGAAGTAAGGATGAGASNGAPWHSVTSFAAMPPELASAAGPSAEHESWLALGGGAAGSMGGGSDAPLGCQDLQLSSSGLQRAVQITGEQDAARAAAVSSWLAAMALQRRLAEHAAIAQQLGRTAAQRDRQAEQAAQRVAALSRRASAKSQMFAEQQAAVAERRAQRAAQQAQQEAEDRQSQVQAALRQHSAAMADLEAALGRTTSGTATQLAAATAAAPAAPAAAGSEEPAEAAPEQQVGQQQARQQQPQQAQQVQQVQQPKEQQRAGLPPLQTRSSRQQRFQEALSQHAEQENAAPRQAAAAPAAGGGQAQLPGQAQPPAQRTAFVPGTASAGGSAFDWPGLQAASAGGAAAVAATLSAAAALEEDADGRDALAPLSAVIEAAVSQSVLSQYRAVSRACVRLFLDELKVLEHLEALRRFFFQGAGDWADALVGQLGAHADSLLPLAAHQADAMLADAARGTSVDGDPYAAHLRLRLLPDSTSAITAQVSAIAIATPQRRARSFWTSKLTVQLAPTQLDALDCIALDYQVGWPLSAILTQDTLQGYTAVFCAMTRVRRVAQLLRALHKPLASQPRSTADLLLSEEDADKAHRRIQRLRAFHFGASQFVGALQAFLHARTAGDAWVHLLAKLMVSSEEVAATLISRQPSAPMTGLLSRMNSLGPTGKAAHKLAQHLTRALSASRPSSPTSAAAAAGGGSGQFARFNSLLSAASGASSAATSPRSVHFGRAPQLSRLGSQAALQGSRSAALSRQQSGVGGLASGAGSPTAAATAAATAGGGLSRQGSLSSVLQAAAAEQQAGGAGAAEPDAAAWARHFQQSQQGIADLQELLDLHRRYVRQASQDCLTWGGSEAACCAVEGALQCLLGFAFRLQAAVRSGAGRRPQDTWTQALRLDDTWRPLAEATAEFEERALQLQDLLQDAGASSPLSELQLDFNGYLQRRRQEQQRQEQQDGQQRRQLAARAGRPRGAV